MSDKGESYKYLNNKCIELGYESLGDFIGDKTTDIIATCMIAWTAEYVNKQANGVSKKNEQALPLADVNYCGFKTEDGFYINPADTPVYFYPTWATDKYPCNGLMNFDNESRKWINYHGNDGAPVFFKRENVDKYINTRHSS